MIMFYDQLTFYIRQRCGLGFDELVSRLSRNVLTFCLNLISDKILNVSVLARKVSCTF